MTATTTPARRTAETASTDCSRIDVPAPREHDHREGYEHLEPVLREYSQLDPGHPRRHRLRQRLVVGYRPVAVHIAYSYHLRGVPLEDLVQVATIGLINAVDRYQPARGESFLAYAVPCARGEVRRYFRDQGWAVRVPRSLKDMHVAITSVTSELSGALGRAPRPSEIAQRLDVSVEEVLQGLQAGNGYVASSLDVPVSADTGGDLTLGDAIGADDPGIELAEFRHAVKPLIEALPERERTILMLRFFRNQTQTQIAERVGLSQMHVSRLLSKTLTSLRSQLLLDD